MEQPYDIFISYVEEDSGIARQFAERLEDSGYKAWYYERDSIPGVSYLVTTGDAIDSCRAMILLISRVSVNSHQVTREVERAHESRIRIIPVLVDLAHEEFLALQPTWRQALGTATSIRIPEDGVESIIPKIIRGLKSGENVPGTRPAGHAFITPRQRISAALGGKIVIEGDNRFIFGHKPATSRVFGRSEIVSECTDLVKDRKCEFLCLTGAVGVGKSTVASLVYNKCAGEPEQDFTFIIWYDLRNEPDPETALIHIATVATGGDIPQDSIEKHTFDIMLNLVRNAFTSNAALVVFDNLDSAFKAGVEAGTFIDERWLEIFRALIGTGSTVVATSHQHPRFYEQTVEFRTIEGLAPDGSLKLLKEAGLKDPDNVLMEAHQLLKGHPMALMALAGAVMRRASYRRSLARAGNIMDVIRRTPDQSRNPFQIFERIISREQLTGSEFDVIRSMPVLLRPETADMINTIIPSMSLDDVMDALDELYLRSLILVDINPDPPLYSLHPLVRDVAERFTEDANILHERAYEYYVSPDCISDLETPACVEPLRMASFHALELKDSGRLKNVLYGEFNLAEKLRGWGRYDLTLPIHSREMELACESGESSDVMKPAGYLSQCLIRVGRMDEALDCAAKALEIAMNLADRAAESRYRGLTGNIYYRMGDYSESEKWLREALEISDSSINPEDAGVIHGLTGRILAKKGEFDAALESFGKALEIAVETGDRLNEIEWSADIGQIHRLRGDYDSAMKVLESGLELAVSRGDRSNEYRISTLMGQIYFSRGYLEKAQELFDQAIEVDREIGNIRHEGAVLALTGKICLIRGDFNEALSRLEKSRNIAIEIGSKGSEAYRTGQIGEILLEKGNLDQALEHLEDAYRNAEESNNKTNQCAWAGKIGEVYLELGRLEEAENWLNIALGMSSEMCDIENECEWRGTLGRLHMVKGDYPEARNQLEKALEIADDNGYIILSRVHNLHLGRLLKLLKDYEPALEHFRKAIEISEKIGIKPEIIESIISELNKIPSEK